MITNTKTRVFLKILDFVIVPLLIGVFLYEPNLLKGGVDFLETGRYLGVIQCILDGKVPHKDFMFPYGMFQIYGILGLMLILGKTLASMKIYFYSVYILSFFMIYILVRSVIKNRFLSYFLMFVCVLEISHPFWSAFWDYGRMGMGILGIILLIRFIRTGSVKYLFVAGTVSGFSVFYGLEVGIFLIITAYIAVLSFSISMIKADLQRTKKTLFRNFVYYNLGIALFLIPVFAVMLNSGALGNYLQTMFYIIPKYYVRTWAQPVVRQDFHSLIDIVPFFMSAANKIYIPALVYIGSFAYLIFSIIRKRWNKNQMIVLVLSIFGVLLYKVSFRAVSGPQFQAALPPVIILIGILSDKAIIRLKEYKKSFLSAQLTDEQKITVAFSVIFLGVALSYFLLSEKIYYGSLSRWLNYQFNKGDFISEHRKPIPLNSVDLVKSGVGRLGNVEIMAEHENKIKEVVDYLRENTRQDEAIFTFPEHGLYNFLADRPVSGRFPIAGLAWTYPGWRDEILSDLKSQKPRIIVYSTKLSNLAKSIRRKEELLPEVSKYILKNYREVKKVDDAFILKLNSSQHTTKNEFF